MNKLNEPMNIVFVSAMNISCINTTLELHILKVTKPIKISNIVNTIVKTGVITIKIYNDIVLS